ncbi:metallophosphoesterase [Sphingomonas nostoxanthinifaciens]|uniref:metallophosphoesterase n=1 Tax=Sphingomonas nostoxanthinifaciens TaxID=2872652 RepID=UPI001CC1EC9C|nr:metallophosphoesterase [Sphingomonas nostoxanthinifaciens]UAK23392.1 metallophosphoesterase [Sphingomonas nostoxanthinifaciens]
MLCVGGAATLLAVAFAEARRDPIVISYRLAEPRLSCAASPLRAALIADLHLRAGDEARLARIVAETNALRPDLILLAGDFFGGDGPPSDDAAARLLAPLAELRAHDGVVAVLGNNDWHDGAPRAATALTLAGVRLIGNDAFVTPRAAVLGIEELYSNTANPPLAQERLASDLLLTHRAAPPVTIWMAHNPTLFDRVRGMEGTMVTGHTHGGQIWPAMTVPLMRWIGRTAHPLAIGFGWSSGRYVRGLYRRGSARMIVTSGIGTSTLPLRLGVPPEIVAIDFTGCPGPTAG